MPLPVKAWVVGEVAASLENESVADALPTVTGSKVTVKEVVWSAARVVGSENPESANSLLSRLIPEMVTDDPVACRVPSRELRVPTTTLPKLKVGEINS